MKKRICFLLSLILLLSLCSSCGKKEVEIVSSQSKDYVYSFVSFNEKIQGIDISDVFCANERILVTSYRYEETPMDNSGMGENSGEEEILPMDSDMEGGELSEDQDMTEETFAEEEAVEVVEEKTVNAVGEEVFYSDGYMTMDYGGGMYDGGFTQTTYLRLSQFDLEGSPIAEFEIQIPENAGVQQSCMDEAGNIYVLLCEYGKDLSNPEYPRDLFSLAAYTQTGEQIFHKQLGSDIEPEEWYYVNEIICRKTDLILKTTKGIEIYELDGTLIKVIEKQELQNSEMYVLGDGQLAFLIYGTREVQMRTLDLEKEELSEKITFPFNTYEYSYYPGLSTDLLLTSNTGVYSYNLGAEGLQKRIDFVDSAILCNNISFLCEVKEGQYFGSYFDNETGMLQFGLFNKVDPSTIKDKKVLTLACYWADDDIRRRVVEYNKTNEEYRIRIEDYYQYNTTDDYTRGMAKMNTDIVSGKMPDIIGLSTDMPINSYISKGLFADLLPFLENDPELKIEDYSEHIIDLYSRNGKWYQLVPGYYLETLFGKASDVGTKPGWTLEELEQLRSQKGEDVAVISELTQSGLLYYCMMFAGNQFVDWEKGECYFNSQEFIDLLEFIKTFPKEINYQELYDNPNYWEQQETIFRDGKALLMPRALSNFQDFLYCEKGTFGEEITAIGFPVKEGVGNVIMSNGTYAISSKSPYQQEAWEFLRYYLTEEYQNTLTYEWPILNSAMEKRIEEAQEVPFYIDENGNKIEYQESYYLNGMEILLDPLTKQDCERVLSFIESAEHVYSYDNAIMNIVSEETAPFFAGEKTAAEAADIIQSRIYIYVNENT